MKVFVCPSPYTMRRFGFVQPFPNMGKFQAVVQAFPNVWEGIILDVGCRFGDLKRLLPKGKVSYCGVDLVVPANVVGSVGIGLPVRNVSSDTVVALDVLEHTDDIYKAFGELCRVARKYVLVTLPNAYDVKSRLRFLLGQRISGKYGLPLDPPNDRHRWLFSFQEARIFIHTMAERHGFEVTAEGCLVGPRRRFAGGRLLASLLPSLLSQSYVALLSRQETN